MQESSDYFGHMGEGRHCRDELGVWGDMFNQLIHMKTSCVQIVNYFCLSD